MLLPTPIETKKVEAIGIEKHENGTPVIEKREEFEAYLAWKSIPSLLRYPPRDKHTKTIPEPRAFALSMGIDDEATLQLIEIKTQAEFADRFKLDQGTLTRWNKLIEERDLLADLRAWAKPLTKNVTMALYNSTLRGGLPGHYELWFKVVNEWSDKLNIDIRKRVIKTVKIEVVDSRPS